MLLAGKAIGTPKPACLRWSKHKKAALQPLHASSTIQTAAPPATGAKACGGDKSMQMLVPSAVALQQGTLGWQQPSDLAGAETGI